jgi:hypothetical protein
MLLHSKLANSDSDREQGSEPAMVIGGLKDIYEKADPAIEPASQLRKA